MNLQDLIEDPVNLLFSIPTVTQAADLRQLHTRQHRLPPQHTPPAGREPISPAQPTRAPPTAPDLQGCTPPPELSLGQGLCCGRAVTPAGTGDPPLRCITSTEHGNSFQHPPIHASASVSWVLGPVLKSWLLYWLFTTSCKRAPPSLIRRQLEQKLHTCPGQGDLAEILIEVKASRRSLLIQKPLESAPQRPQKSSNNPRSSERTYHPFSWPQA